jgi:L-ascorbate metabolism protein UlaG (beta-lactamase superfamily)
MTREQQAVERPARRPQAKLEPVALPATEGAGAPDLREGSVEFIGTATTLIRYAGFALLTDPNFLHAGDHVHLGYGLTSRRLTNPAREIDDLPPLDLCVLSHMHEDHWDRVAQTHLRHDLPVVTTRHAALELRRQGFTRPYVTDPWQSVTFAKGEAWLSVTAMPGRHGPGPVQGLMPPVMGSLLEWGRRDQPARFRLYISGDTLLIDELRDIPRRYPDIDLGLFHLGGTRVMGVLVTMDGRQGVQAIKIVRPRVAIPIHYNDYTVFKSPLDDFLKEVRRAGLKLTSEVRVLQHGESYQWRVDEGE